MNAANNSRVFRKALRSSASGGGRFAPVAPAGDASLQSLPRGLRPFSEEKGLKNLKRLFCRFASVAQFASQVQLGIESRQTAPSFRRALVKHRAFRNFLALHREAIKVFLEFLEPFSSEKGSKPPEALAAKPRTGAKRQKREKSAKGF